MKLKNLRAKQKDEFLQLLREKKAEVGRLRMELVTGKIKNVRKLRDVRREIAQILTVIKEGKL